jgi:hypothetical protein
VLSDDDTAATSPASSSLYTPNLKVRGRGVFVRARLPSRRLASPAGRPVVAPSNENIINLMDALKRSLGTEKVPPELSGRGRNLKVSKNKGRASKRR